MGGSPVARSMTARRVWPIAPRPCAKTPCESGPRWRTWSSWPSTMRLSAPSRVVMYPAIPHMRFELADQSSERLTVAHELVVDIDPLDPAVGNDGDTIAVADTCDAVRDGDERPVTAQSQQPVDDLGLGFAV